MATKKNTFSIRINRELFETIEQFTEFLNKELLKKKITRTNFMENLFIRGLEYYFNIAEEHCNDRQKNRLNELREKLHEYVVTPWERETKINKTMLLDTNTYKIMQSYTEFQNMLYCRDMTVVSLLCGNIVKGIDFYMNADKLFLEHNNVNLNDYDYWYLFDQLELIKNQQAFELEFK